MFRRTIRVAVFAVCTSLAAPVAAQDYNVGLEAARRGDYATALENWQPLAEQGYAYAQYSLGLMYKNGDGVPQDYAEALRWYRLAAEQGYAYAQHNLGSMYENGQGVPQDYIMAHIWLNLASANGSKKGGEWRDKVAAKMTPADISEAQRRARVCMSSGYEDCD